jgi:hypothetical protein
MKIKTLGICLALSVLGSVSQAWAVGEVLKLETFGTQYCAGKAPLELDPTNSQAFWAKVDSDTQITAYLDAGLTVKAFTLPVTLTALPDDDKGRGQSALNILLGPTPGGYIAFNGILKTNKAKTLVNYLKVDFIRRGLLDTCTASGYMVGRRVL